MPFHVLCYLGQNEHNENSTLGNNKMADQNNSAIRANLNSPVKPEEENLRSVFSPLLERSFPIPILPILIPVETKKRRPTLYPLFCDVSPLLLFRATPYSSIA